MFVCVWLLHLGEEGNLVIFVVVRNQTHFQQMCVSVCAINCYDAWTLLGLHPSNKAHTSHTNRRIAQVRTCIYMRSSKQFIKTHWTLGIQDKTTKLQLFFPFCVDHKLIIRPLIQEYILVFEFYLKKLWILLQTRKRDGFIGQLVCLCICVCYGNSCVM